MKEDIDLSGAVSDSRVIAAGTFKKGRSLLKKIDTSRFAILSRNGFELFGSWIEKGGCHFSNMAWAPRPVTTSKPGKAPPAPAKKKEQPELALHHGKMGLVREAMACFGD